MHRLLIADRVSYEDLTAYSTINVEDEWWEVADIDRRFDVLTLIRTDDAGNPLSIRIYKPRPGESFPRMGF
jgi:hypothetical protein